jgi:hypothetical protein
VVASSELTGENEFCKCGDNDAHAVTTGRRHGSEITPAITPEFPDRSAAGCAVR